MQSLECATRFLNLQIHGQLPLPLPLISRNKFSYPLLVYKYTKSGIRLGLPNLCALPQSQSEDKDVDVGVSGSISKQEEEEEEEEEEVRSSVSMTEKSNSETIITACLVGLVTGIAVVVFNNAVSHSHLSMLINVMLCYVILID
jgi:hypothetical protein